MKTGNCFDDVLLVPQFSDIMSRSEIELISYLDQRHRFRLPIISSPMDTVTGPEMAKATVSYTHLTLPTKRIV